VTGVILALNLPTTTTVWQMIVGALFAIIVVKCFFGGIGCNFANPAATARVFLVIAFAEIGAQVPTVFADLVAGATPLGNLATGVEPPSLLDMFLGNRGGAMGETCAIAILIGFAYLLIRRIIAWQVPVTFVLTVFVLSWIFTGDITLALYHVLSGGLLFAAVFMATDYVTTPIRTSGRIVFALGCGIITVLIRFFGSYPEGVSFSILLMNILSPYIDKLVAKVPFGGKRK
jgi:electron transport complex protein RnfD